MKIYLIGLGPGEKQGMTEQALTRLEECDVIVGYQLYVKLIRPHFPGKEFFATAMTREVDRCRKAVELALAGKTVAVVCSGDPGVYGMAGLLCEVAEEYPPIEIEVIPGVTAALSGAAVLGAPLVHDFAVISLSDLLTPWKSIEKRLLAAAEADFVLCLYNPASKKRADYLKRACDLILSVRSPNTVCGWVRSIGRSGQQKGILPLSALREFQADMFTTVFIGNSHTKELRGRMVTPRGYRDV